MLKRLKHQGITILVSTPYMDEASLCERIALIQAGRILSIDTPNAIINSYPGQLFMAKSDSIRQLLADIRAYAPVHSTYTFGQNLHITFTQDKADNQADLIRYLEQKGHTGIEVNVITPTIEDRFIELMTR